MMELDQPELISYTIEFVRNIEGVIQEARFQRTTQNLETERFSSGTVQVRGGGRIFNRYPSEEDALNDMLKYILDQKAGGFFE